MQPPTTPNPHAATLDALIAIGAELAADIRQARETNEITPTQAAEAFERVARATRRTILLAARLAETPSPQSAETVRNATRREIIRTVEDAIHRDPRTPTPESKDALETEFRERLDAPELAEDLESRPVAAVIADILRDLDLGRPPYTTGPHWRRRPPAAIRRLHALAAGTAPLPPDTADPEPRQRPPPQPGPTPGRLHRLILPPPSAPSG